MPLPLNNLHCEAFREFRPEHPLFLSVSLILSSQFGSFDVALRNDR
jgi:hypothetical protein